MKKAAAVSGILDEVLSSLGLASVRRMARLCASWPDIAGPLLAGKTAPSKLSNGVLTVLVCNHSWAQELQLGKPVLLAKIRDVMGSGEVRDVRFLVGPIPDPGEEAGEGGADLRRREPARAPARPVPEPEGIDGIGDPETREILLSLSRKAARRR